MDSEKAENNLASNDPVANESTTNGLVSDKPTDLFEISDIHENNEFSCFAIKIKGASHIKDGLACQDSVKITTFDIGNKKFLVVAIADGHGSKKHYLSKFGADFLTDCMCHQLHNIVQEEKTSTIDIFYKRLKENLPPKLFASWGAEVLHDYTSRIQKGTEPEMESENDILAKYGTTAMFCVSFGNSLLFGKLDGNIVVCENEEYTELISNDDNLMGSEAYSMCKRENALNKWDFGISHSADFLTISTDGLRNAFGEDDDNTKFIDAIKNIHDYINTHTPKETLDSLLPFLRRCSDNGSADDITLACLVKKEMEAGELSDKKG